MKNWKTSIVGIILIVLGIVSMPCGVDKTIGGAIITAGLGFLVAKDNDVTGGTREQ